DVLGADPQALRSILEVRLLGVVHAVRQAGPKIREGGSITMMSGLYSTRPAVGGAVGGGGVAGGGGVTRGPALGLAPVPRHRRGPWLDRPAALGRLRAAAAGHRRAGGPVARRPDRPAGGGRRGGLVPHDQRVRDRHGLADRWRRRARLTARPAPRRVSEHS